MSEISNEIPDGVEETEKSKQSPWVMLVTMILLISGLLLSSFMMLFYAWKRTDKSPMHSFDLSALVKQSATSMQQTVDLEPAQAIADEQSTNPSPALLSKTNGDTVKWPRLKLSGFGASSDGKSGFAIINGDQMLQGETLGKITLLEVHAHTVVVEYMGEQKALTMGIDN